MLEQESAYRMDLAYYERQMTEAGSPAQREKIENKIFELKIFCY